MDDSTVSVASLMVPLEDVRWLLPNAAVAEIVGYREPESAKDAPEWLLGFFTWRGMHLPLISYEAVVGRPAPAPQNRRRVAVMNTLNGNPDLPFFAVVLAGIPRLVRADASTVNEGSTAQVDHPTVLKEALVGDQPVLIPDIDALERLLNDLPA